MSADIRYLPSGSRPAQRLGAGSSDSVYIFIVLFSHRTTLKANSLQFETTKDK